MKIDTIKSKEKKKIRKYFKYEKENYIRRFCKVKYKKITLAIFNVSENEKVLKTKKSQNSKI